MEEKKPTILLYVLNAIMPLIELGGTDIFASNSLWSLVLGVMPSKEGERENKIMELNRKDETKYKVQGIERITHLATSITKREDFDDENLLDFTYAIRQLSRYVWGDDKASLTLNELKDMYISYMTKYYYHALEYGEKEAAINKLELFGEEILREDRDLRERLAQIAAYKPLN